MRTRFTFFSFLQRIILIVGQMAVIVRQPRPVLASPTREFPLIHLPTFTAFSLCLPSYRILRGFRTKISTEAKHLRFLYTYILHFFSIHLVYWTTFIMFTQTAWSELIVGDWRLLACFVSCNFKRFRGNFLWLAPAKLIEWVPFCSYWCFWACLFYPPTLYWISIKHPKGVYKRKKTN
jgi:hypothetical protein